MNKKGFTLVELLATMAILAIISAIAIPNILRIMDDNKKDKVISDAESLIALAKYEVAKNSSLRESLDSGNVRLSLRTLDNKNTIMNDPNNNAYNRDDSNIIVSKSSGIIEYCVYLVSQNFKVSMAVNNDNCVKETIILGDNPKRYVNDVES